MATAAEPHAGDVTVTENTLTGHRDVGALAAATEEEPSPGVVEHAERRKPTEATGSEASGADDDPAKTAPKEGQPGPESKPSSSDFGENL